jgi:OOP family OmpA-OmpF porin
MTRIFVALWMLAAGAVQAQTLSFPSNATLQAEVSSPIDSYAMPIGIWDRGEMPTRVVEGALIQQAWRIDAAALTTLQLLRPLREQLRNQRFRVTFECQTEACGGFDFRFAVDTMPPPEMRINIGDFRFLAAERLGGDGPEYVTIFVSRTSQSGFVQISQVAPISEDAAVLATTTQAPLGASEAEATPDLAVRLDAIGRAVLDDLDFATGSARLGEAQFGSLQALATYLTQYPDRTVALVGHTDASGSLPANIELSKRRAASVLERLVSDYNVPRSQLEAEGMGYLAPIASNLTEAGRNANRRVEVIITSTTE